jgi:hypothetical protein
MRAKSQKTLALLERRRSVADLALKGWTQEAIAEQLGISQATVSLDIQRIAEEYKDACLKYAEHARGIELARLQRIEREAWGGWERSQKPTQTAVLNGDDGLNPNSSKARRTVKNQVGDPRFLDLIVRTSAQRRALLGLDATPTDDRNESVTPDLRRDTLLTIFGVLRERQRIEAPGTEPGDEQPGTLCIDGQSGQVETGQAPA